MRGFPNHYIEPYTDDIRSGSWMDPYQGIYPDMDD